MLDPFPSVPSIHLAIRFNDSRFVSELAAELLASNDAGDVDEWNDGAADVPDADWQNWMPDPVDADPAKSSKQRRCVPCIWYASLLMLKLLLMLIFPVSF